MEEGEGEGGGGGVYEPKIMPISPHLAHTYMHAAQPRPVPTVTSLSPLFAPTYSPRLRAEP